MTGSHKGIGFFFMGCLFECELYPNTGFFDLIYCQIEDFITCFWSIIIFLFAFLIGFNFGHKEGAIDYYFNKISVSEKDGQYIVKRKTPKITPSFRDMP